MTEHDFFGRTTAVGHHETRFELLTRHGNAVVFGERERNAESAAARHDGDLVQRVVTVDHHGAHGVSGLVEGREAALFFLHDERLALGAQHDAILRFLEIAHVDLLVILAGGEQRAFVHEIGEIGASHTRGATRERGHAHVVGDGLVAQVHLEDTLAATKVGRVHHDLAVEATRAQQRGIEHVGAVRRGDEDDAVVRLEAVHLHEELIERLLALIMTTTKAGATVTAHGIDFVDEDDARRMRLALLEQIAHARGTDADEHFNEVGTGHAEERTPRFTGHGLGEQRLTGTRRAHEERALGEATAKLCELLRVLEELDDFLKLDLGFVSTGHVGERDLGRVAAEQLRLALAERERLVAAGLHLAEQENPEADEEQVRQHGHEEAAEVGARLRRGRLHAGLVEVFLLLGGRALHQAHGKPLGRAVGHPDFLVELAREDVVGERGLLDVAGGQLLAVIGIADFRGGRFAAVTVREERHRNEEHEDPERNRLGDPAPVGGLLRRGRHVCCHGITALLQAGHVREVPEILGMIQSVPDQKFVRGIEPDEPRGMVELGRDVLVQQRADFQRLGLAFTEECDEPTEGPPGIHDVLNEENVFAFQFRFRIIQQTHDTARFHGITVRRGDQEIHLQRPIDVSDQVAQKDETALEQPQHQQIALWIGRRDRRPQLAHLGVDRRRIVDDALDRTPVEPRIGHPARVGTLNLLSQTRAHTDTRSVPASRAGTVPQDRGRLRGSTPVRRWPAIPATTDDPVREPATP